MKIILPGGRGQVGTVLARAFHRDGHDVVVLSRKPVPEKWRTVAWDGKTLGPWAKEIDGADVIINLAGHSVNCRYTVENRKLIKESRVDSTRVVGRAIAQAENPPPVWLQAGTATIYEHRYSPPNDEIAGVVGLGSQENPPDTWRFSIDVAQAWEAAANEAVVPRTRKVLLRAAMVMSPDPGGVFDVLLRLVRFGLGGKFGDGRQMISWIHHADFVRAAYWIIEHKKLDGPVNSCAPAPVSTDDFMRILRQNWGRHIGLPATKWMLEIGTFFMRSETELVLKSRSVVPTRLLNDGFQFEFPTWEVAAEELCHSARVGRR